MLNGPGTMLRGSNVAPLPIGVFHGAFTANGHDRASRVPALCTGPLTAGAAVVGVTGIVVAGAFVVVPTVKVLSSLLFDSFDSAKRFTSSTKTCTVCDPALAAVHVV